MRNPNGHYDPKKPQFCRILPMFSHFLARIFTFHVFFSFYFQKKCKQIACKYKIKKTECATLMVMMTLKNCNFAIFYQYLAILLARIFMFHVFFHFIFRKSINRLHVNIKFKKIGFATLMDIITLNICIFTVFWPFEL